MNKFYPISNSISAKLYLFSFKQKLKKNESIHKSIHKCLSKNLLLFDYHSKQRWDCINQNKFSSNQSQYNFYSHLASRNITFKNLQKLRILIIVQLLLEKMKIINKAAQFKTLLHQTKYGLYLHEYQAYDLLKKYKLPLVPSFRASTPEDAYAISQRIMSTTTKNRPFVDVVVKAQVHAGGRGKGTFKQSGLKGGVQMATKASQVLQYAQKMIGKTLVTPQTGSIGKKCNDVFLVEKIFLRKELYLSFLLDRTSGSMAIIASPRGGMNIEEVDSNKVHKFFFPPSKTIPTEILDKIANCYELTEQATIEMGEVIKKLYQCFIDNDATLVEINPVGVDIEGKIKICDSKINIDDNAGFRQKQIFMSEDLSQKNWKQVEAERHDLNYIALDGNIGCMVNGAGLAMATMDLIQTKGGKPANFLDVGGRATDQQVVAALKIMDSDPNVESILVNIFAGIARADIIALGLIKGISVLGMKKPIVLRMKGTNIQEAQKIISDSGFNMVLTEDLQQAATKAVKMAEILKMARQAKLNVSLL